MKILHALFLPLAIVLLHACALSPQVVVINPELSPEGAGATQPLRLRVDVVDTRSSPVIGQRGGVYKETSHISTDKNMTATLQRKLSGAFAEMGYEITDKSGADVYLTVNTSEIAYEVIEDNVLNQVKIDVGLEAVAQKADRQFKRNYGVSRKKDVVKTPDAEGNEDMVNEAMTIALQNLISDKELLKFINN